MSDEATCLELTRTFERDLAVSDRVTKDAWKHRGLPHKTVEALASFVQDQV